MMQVDPRDFTPDALRKVAPVCQECGPAGRVDLVGADVIYPHRPDLRTHADGLERWYWRCSCGAYVGTHKGTIKPLGSPAGQDTRRAREAAHAAFDPMWQKRQRLSGVSKATARNRGYKWLAEQLGIDRRNCHIGMMDAATARRVVEVCRSARNAAAAAE